MIVEDARAFDLRKNVIRLIRLWEAAFERIGERAGPLVRYDDDSPETTIPRAEWESLSERLCRAIRDYTLHVNLESGPVRYKGKLYHPILEGQGPRAWTCCIDPAEAVEIDDRPLGEMN